jgi:hypothetical protein
MLREFSLAGGGGKWYEDREIFWLDSKDAAGCRRRTKE